MSWLYGKKNERRMNKVTKALLKSVCLVKDDYLGDTWKCIDGIMSSEVLGKRQERCMKG